MNLPFNGTYTIIQKFAESPEYYKQFGLNGHDGIDFGCPDGTAIIATESGRVMQPSAPRDFGNFVAIWHPALHSMSWYCHLRSSSVTPGTIVSQGQVIGISNNTGHSRGSHLHFGISQTDNDGQVINKGNGFGGFINPLPFIENSVASNVFSPTVTVATSIDYPKPMSTWIWEGIKTSGRFSLILFLSVLIESLTKTQAGVDLPDNAKWLIALALAGLDRAVHEWRKDTGTETNWKGLVGF